MHFRDLSDIDYAAAPMGWRRIFPLFSLQNLVMRLKIGKIRVLRWSVNKTGSKCAFITYKIALSRLFLFCIGCLGSHFQHAARWVKAGPMSSAKIKLWPIGYIRLVCFFQKYCLNLWSSFVFMNVNCIKSPTCIGALQVVSINSWYYRTELSNPNNSIRYLIIYSIGCCLVNILLSWQKHD